MKSDKKLKEIFNKSKGEDTFYTFEFFKRDSKNFLKEIRKRNLVMSMKVSRSGMTRHFNSIGHNMLLNICYNQTKNYEDVKVGGCGMDMHWHLLFRTCEMLATKKEHEKYNYNSLSSSQPLL